jgi:hypothetical protein
MVQRFLSSHLFSLRAAPRCPLRTLTNEGCTQIKDIFMIITAEKKIREAVKTTMWGDSLNAENTE